MAQVVVERDPFDRRTIVTLTEGRHVLARTEISEGAVLLEPAQVWRDACSALALASGIPYKDVSRLLVAETLPRWQLRPPTPPEQQPNEPQEKPALGLLDKIGEALLRSAAPKLPKARTVKWSGS